MVTKVTAANIQDKVTTGDKAAALINDNKRAINQVIDAKEESLGNPVNDGRLLTSTAAGVRSWVDVGRSRTFKSLTDAVDYVTLNPATLDQVTTVSDKSESECISLGIDYPDGNGGDYIVVEDESLIVGEVIAAGVKQLKLITLRYVPIGTAASKDTGTEAGQVPLNTNIVYPVATVADLRLLEPTVDGQQFNLLEYNTGTGLGGGPCYYDASDTTTADDGGSVFVTATGKRIKRIDASEKINVEQWGAVPDNSALTVDAVSRILSKITTSDATAGFSSNQENGGVIYFPKSEFDWKHYSDLTIKADNTFIAGDGMRSSVIDFGDYKLQWGESNIDATHGFYDPVSGPAFCGIKDIEIKSTRTESLDRSTVLDTVHYFLIDNVFFNNSGHHESIGLELVTAQWIVMNRVFWSGYGSSAALYMNAAGAGHGHVHLEPNCQFLDKSATVSINDSWGGYIVAHSYTGDGTQGSPSNLGGSFFGKWEETSINGVHFHQTNSTDVFTEFSGIKTRGFEWPSSISPADRDKSVEVLAQAMVSSCWFEGLHTISDLNGSDRIEYNALQTLTNGRTVRGIVNGESGDSSITITSADINGLLADGKYAFSSISGGVIEEGQYFIDASGNSSRVTHLNSSGDQAYCVNTIQLDDQVDFDGVGESVTFYTDQSGTLPTGVTATATKTEQCALISTSQHLLFGNVGIDGSHINKNNILDIKRLNSRRTHCTQREYGDGSLFLFMNVSQALSDVNNDFSYPAEWPQGLTADKGDVTLTAEGEFAFPFWLDSINETRVRIKTDGTTGSTSNARVSIRMFD